MGRVEAEPGAAPLTRGMGWKDGADDVRRFRSAALAVAEGDRRRELRVQGMGWWLDERRRDGAPTRHAAVRLPPSFLAGNGR